MGLCQVRGIGCRVWGEGGTIQGYPRLGGLVSQETPHNRGFVMWGGFHIGMHRVYRPLVNEVN